jgi:hypothetical protein
MRIQLTWIRHTIVVMRPSKILLRSAELGISLKASMSMRVHHLWGNNNHEEEWCPSSVMSFEVSRFFIDSNKVVSVCSDPNMFHVLVSVHIELVRLNATILSAVQKNNSVLARHWPDISPSLRVQLSTQAGERSLSPLGLPVISAILRHAPKVT